MELAFTTSAPLIGIRAARFTTIPAPSLSANLSMSSRRPGPDRQRPSSGRTRFNTSSSPSRPSRRPAFSPSSTPSPSSSSSSSSSIPHPPPSSNTAPSVDEPSRVRKRERKPTQRATQSDYDRVMQLSSRKDKRPARQMFQTCTATYPNDGRLWLAWAQMESRIGNAHEARRIFSSGADVNPENVHLLHAWAVFEERAEHFDDARRLLRRCISLAPGDGLSYQGLALLYQRNRKIDQARETFKQGVIADESNESLWSAWAVLEHRQENYKAAAELFEKALELNPNHSRSLQAYAITAEKLGELHKSEDLFKQALRIAPKSVPTYQAYGMFEARRDNLDKARNLFQCGLNYNERHAAIWHAWAIMEQDAANYDVARDLFQRGVSAVPKSTPLLRAWAQMELALGHIDKGANWRVPRGGYKPGHRNSSSSKSDISSRRSNPRSRREYQEKKQMSIVAENLLMLRLMIERKSDEDVRTAMKWLDGRAKTDRELYDALTRRPSKDVRVVQEWVERRSSGDIKAFRKWLDARYEKDRRIGVYVFNWELPPLSQPSKSAEADQKEQDIEIERPVEWFRLEETPEKSLQSFDEDFYYDEETPDYADGLYFLSHLAGGLADRAALALCLVALTFFLVASSSTLDQLGYSPSGEQAQVVIDPTGEIPPPSGVDAHLYEEGGADAVVDEISIRTFGKGSS